MCLLCFYRFSEVPEAVLGDFLLKRSMRLARDMPSHRPFKQKIAQNASETSEKR